MDSGIERYDEVMILAEAQAEWDEAMEFGSETGECGICGVSLEDADLEQGVCWEHFIEYCETFEVDVVEVHMEV